LILLAVVAVFLPVCWHEFLEWDDNVNIAHNDDFKPLTSDSLAHYWTAPKYEEYLPVTYTVWGLLSVNAYNPATGEIDPTTYHALNLIFHGLAALVVYALLMELGAARWAACAGAVLFAIHPLQVEPVAWATGLKDVLSGLLCLCALWCYVRFIRYQGNRSIRIGFYAGSVVAFLLAILAKPTAVSLPLAAGAIAFFILKRGFRQTILDMLPWLVPAITLALVAMHAQPAKFATHVAPVYLRPVIALDALAFYVYKFFLPLHLMVDYGRTPGWVLHNPQVYFTWFIPIGLALAAWLLRRRAPWVAAGLLVFAAAPAPLLGIIPFGFQTLSTVTDRYVYAGLLGPAIILAFVLTRWHGRVITGIVIAALLALVVRAALQVPYWQDTESVFNHTAQLNPSSTLAKLNIGVIRLHQDRLAEAKTDFVDVLAIDPGDVKARTNLASVLVREGQPDAAIAEYNRVLAAEPGNAEAHYDLGNVLLRTRRPAEAIPHYQEALKLLSQHAGVHTNLGIALAMMNRPDDAIAELKRAVELDSNNARLHTQLGDLMASRGDYAGAMEHFTDALRIDPNLQSAQQKYAMLQQFLQQRPR
jgi:tetratricopeptide (TPR) repeat protein